LSTPEIYAVMDDLKDFGVPVLILSGGEPLMHPDILPIAARAKAMGFYVGLSSNGTLIDRGNIDRIGELDLDYVGISLDGMRDVHDRFRRRAGAFDEALNGVRLCLESGIRVGLRFTLTRDNFFDLPELLGLMRTEGVDKFYLSHLNYAGRGNRNRKDDALLKMTREAMELLIETCLEDIAADRASEFVTGNNDADGVFLLHWVRRHLPGKASPAGAHAAQLGRQLIGREHRQHRQPRQRPSGYHVVGLHHRQRARTGVHGDLAGHQ
jgi:Fe-coproporphyrin III synthase